MLLAQALTEALSIGYLRYLDFQRLEKQNRSLEIEQALERVRTQVAAMQESEDLFKVQSTVHEQLTALAVPSDHVGIDLVGESARTLRSFAPDSSGEEFSIPIDQDTPVDLDWPREFLIVGLSRDVPVFECEDQAMAA